ncbi:MAG: clan AA aspartic protease [Pirellulaceae bacterium]|nr:clan AA aspartic protease [Pirellulaceae bacterium]
MIRGSISAELVPRVPFTLLSESGVAREVQAVLDTGFNSALTVPSRFVKEVGMKPLGKVRMILGDGSEHLCPTYEAIVEWDGLPMVVVAEICDLDPMIGMGLLRGFRVAMEVEPGGALTIEQM